MYGRKTVFIWGSLGLTAFSLGLGFANGKSPQSHPILCPISSNSHCSDEITLDVLRGLQGVGGAATIPSAVSCLVSYHEPGADSTFGADWYFSTCVPSLSNESDRFRDFLRWSAYWCGFWDDLGRGID